MGIIACKEQTKKEPEQITKERRASALEKSGLEGDLFSIFALKNSQKLKEIILHQCIYYYTNVFQVFIGLHIMG
jgi:hypothetical protein